MKFCSHSISVVNWQLSKYSEHGIMTNIPFSVWTMHDSFIFLNWIYTFFTFIQANAWTEIESEKERQRKREREKKTNKCFIELGSSKWKTSSYFVRCDVRTKRDEKRLKKGKKRRRTHGNDSVFHYVGVCTRTKTIINLALSLLRSG